MALSTIEQLLYSTVRIEADGVGTGTGFFFEFSVDDETVPALVTNKHVLRGSSNAHIVFHTANTNGEPESGRFYRLSISGYDGVWFEHPDAEVDLCALPVVPLVNHARKAGQSIFFKSLPSNIVPTPEAWSELDPIEDVTMIGYPNGIWDSHNNMPIVRRGITATHPRRDYEGKSQFLIDASCFPGSSGSPVLLYNRGTYANGDSITLGSRLHLLGILYAGHMQSITGEIVQIRNPSLPRPVSVSQIPIGLGLVIKATELDGFVDAIRKRIARTG